MANRVCSIQVNTGNHNWVHVRSEHNPGDLGRNKYDNIGTDIESRQLKVYA